ncbi:hypothetical protein BVER_02547c [Candidatus Burkholderia verschuerenii]|uniref:Peptidase S8/S53 domain-containing protein n=1 Tax=Candidatus Burkholderia verschuerenii TaxID=242163 RepID=A0A0L0M3C9_9BURK|nr:S8 family serine peptidase [Candidatus Burkholderia verschuerenii]KND57137.1 hypothetical protein BVER_02547c [Candidatus Burkholderia verschuerenii]
MFDQVDQNNDNTWLKLWIINVGEGQQTLIPNSTSELSVVVNMLKDSIVNMSIEYPPNANGNDLYFLQLMNTTNNNLFVVSAGNDGSADVGEAPYYPAVLGGNGQKNVITVAANLPDGHIARFSNRGATHVDLAAPGCELSSWLDDSGRISKVSGTSQAAAVVTFAAALIKSLGSLLPVEIKNRLIVSGDPLLHPGTPAASGEASASEPAPEEILSRSRLNLATSLYLFDDYMRYRTPDGQVHESLGLFQGVSGISCEQPIGWKNLWSLKKTDRGLLVFKGRMTPQLIAGEPCLAKSSPDAMLRLKVRADIDEHGTPEPVTMPRTVQIRLADLEEYVAASRSHRKTGQ